jgi:nitroreductase
METYMLEDCAAAAQSMLLCAHGLGLGGIWCGVKLPHKIVPVAVLGFGHPAEERTRPPRYEAGKVYEEQW